MNIFFRMTEAADSIAIVGHTRPDGDCVGACLAVYNYLAEQYPDKEIAVYLETPPEKFRYLTNVDKISQNKEGGVSYDLCICLDCGDPKRFGDFAVYAQQARKTLCIDHHITNNGYSDENLIETGASSTCEILAGLMADEKISRAVAECLYTGILHDTNVFKNSNTTGKTMIIAGRMMDKGIHFSGIIDRSFCQKTYVQNQILGRALLESIMFLHGTCIFTVVRKCDMEFYGIAESDLDGIVDQLRVTAGVECAILLTEVANHEYKVSMRSNFLVDVSKIAAYFGGGGHVRAAGCTLSGSAHDVVNNLAVHIERQMMAKEDRLLPEDGGI